MKKILPLLLLSFCLFGCESTELQNHNTTENSSNTTGSETEQKKSDITIVTSDDAFPQQLAEQIRLYFQAIEDNDTELYRSTLYPYFAEQMEIFLQEEYGYGLSGSLEGMRENFDGEFHFTQLILAQQDSEDDGAKSYVESLDTILGVGFGDHAKEELSEIGSVMFTIYGTINGSEEAILVDTKEMITVLKDDQWYVLG